jgi:large subunit ribosomal protein L15
MTWKFMNFLQNLAKITTKPSKRVGRGYGGGKGGHTVGRGQKGQKSRSNPGLLFEGTKRNKDFFRRTPWLRGKNRLKSYQADPVILKLSQLDIFNNDDEVSAKSLVKHKLITEKEALSKGVKILFDKKIDKKLNIKVSASKTVLKNINKV